METEAVKLPNDYPKEGFPWAPVAYEVYFIYCAGRVKIGRSTNVRQRLLQIATGSPYNPHLILTVPGTLSAEKMLHQRFAEDRTRGEWFQLSTSLRGYLRHRLTPEGRVEFATAEGEFLDSLTTPAPKGRRKKTRKLCEHGQPWMPMCPTCVRDRDLKILDGLKVAERGPVQVVGS